MKSSLFLPDARINPASVKIHGTDGKKTSEKREKQLFLGAVLKKLYSRRKGNSPLYAVLRFGYQGREHGSF